MVSIFPRVSAATASGPGGEQPPPAAANMGSAEAAPAPATAAFATAPHRQQPDVITWEAHDHNVTGISAFPFPAPVWSTAAPSTIAARASPPPAAAGATGASLSPEKEGAIRPEGVGESAAVGKKRRRPEDGAGAGGGGGGEAGTEAAAAAASDGIIGSTALIYTCSMDGSCKEWEVGVPAAGAGAGVGAGGGRETAKAR